LSGVAEETKLKLKRREFLVQSVAAMTLPAAGRQAAFAAPGATLSGEAALNSAQVIWCADARPVELQSGGKAEGIAGSSSGPSSDRKVDFHCVFAREFTVSAAPSRAVIHLFAFTRYLIYINGVYAGRGPSRYQNQRPEYDSRDIATLLRAGRNVVVVLVHRDAPTGRIMRHEPGFIAALEVVQDGNRQVLATYTSWRSMLESSFGPRAEAWASIEEHIDARNVTDWASPDLSRPEWQAAIVVSSGRVAGFFPRTTPLQLEKERSWTTDAPVFPIDLAAGSELSLQLPEIAQAYHVLEMEADAGSLLEITYCLPQGEESGKCSYIARAGRQTHMGGDTFAFRRFKLTLRSGRIRLLNASAHEVRYPFELAASFKCSDPFLTQLWGICARSLQVLSEDAYVDCADRERVEWTDNSPPGFDCTRVMMRGPDENGKPHWGDARLLGGLLRRIALTQRPDGQLKAHSCSERWDIHAIMEDRSCDWVVQLREYLESTGDADLVRELWPALRRMLDWFRQRRTDRGLVLAREWEVWDNPLRYQGCEGAGLNAFVYKAFSDAAQMAARIGLVDQAGALAQEAEKLRNDFNRLLWNEQEGAYDGALFGPGSEVRSPWGQKLAGPIVNGRYQPTTQGNLFALYCGIVPAERIGSVWKWVFGHLDDVRQPMSHYYLFQMMYAMEEAQLDAEILRLMRAGWKNQVESEWQTTWEGLDKDTGSRIHIYSMHPGYFLTAYVLGARRIGKVECRQLLIEPRFSGLEWAKGVCVTEFGPVEMEWRVDAQGRPEIICAIPEGVNARVRLRWMHESDKLEVDSRVVASERANGWIETGLVQGKHRLRLVT
jgi:hypothetical protein